MSQTDSFIEEVSDEVRRERLFGYFRKYAWIAAVVIVFLVGGTAVYNLRSAQVQEQERLLGSELAATLTIEDADEQKAALDVLATPSDASIVSKLLAATDDSELSIGILNDVIADDTQPGYVHDLARLRLVMVHPEMPADEKLAILEKLSQPGSIYQSVATELLILHHLDQGDKETAVSLAREQIADATTLRQQVRRLQELLVTLGETL